MIFSLKLVFTKGMIFFILKGIWRVMKKNVLSLCVILLTAAVQAAALPVPMVIPTTVPAVMVTAEVIRQATDQAACISREVRIRTRRTNIRQVRIQITRIRLMDRRIRIHQVRILTAPIRIRSMIIRQVPTRTIHQAPATTKS
jgi:hypothetical protein